MKKFKISILEVLEALCVCVRVRACACVFVCVCVCLHERGIILYLAYVSSSMLQYLFISQACVILF